MQKNHIIIFASGGILFLALGIWLIIHNFIPETKFDGERAYNDVLVQVGLGPRIPGSAAHDQAIAYIVQELDKAGWQVTVQNTTWLNFRIQNILASRSNNEIPILIGAHYDSRIQADQDVGSRAALPVPGANDGASGVAILLELARILPTTSIPVQLVFFDAEDDGGLDNMQWIMGSRAYVASLSDKPRAAIILDMVGDPNLKIYMERNSDPSLTTSIWDVAGSLGYDQFFIPRYKYSMIDDHTPFLEVGIPAVDIIDFDYPYWHTTEDTPDKVSANSLQIVGDTIYQWIVNQK
jgi:glutaminyl-peptide cyclotransferase